MQTVRIDVRHEDGVSKAYFMKVWSFASLSTCVISDYTTFRLSKVKKVGK